MGHVAVVLAAGKGTRMKSELPKVLHPVAGWPMVRWVLEAVTPTGPHRTVVVVGHGAEDVRQVLPDGVEIAVQEPQLGTAHATSVALAALGTLPPDASVLVVPGDTPMLTADVLDGLLEFHRESGATVTMLTAELDDPTGYGRVIRSADGSVAAVVEHKDATAGELAVREVNAGMYVFGAGLLAAGLERVSNDNAQGEYYLTDLVAHAVEAGERVSARVVAEEVVAGVNDHAQLAAAAAARRSQLARWWMSEGVWMQDPDSVYLDATVRLAPGVRLYPDVHLEGDTIVAAGATVGPSCFAVDSRIGEGARVWYSVLRKAEVGPGAEVGPYASLRPGTVLERNAKAGTFVEMKQTRVGEGAKVPHLAYLGDADVGESANVGAGTITCNYDGYEKHQTRIGARAFIGSDTMLVAPVTIGEGAVTGAGSTITKDVPDGALGVERADQRVIPDYASRRAARYREERRRVEDA
jgi:bifunctional UDP-N-acetylglucosamine pyrophosphorylase / glucosamine-1-phosphate N-acetyltransferase